MGAGKCTAIIPAWTSADAIRGLEVCACSTFRISERAGLNSTCTCGHQWGEHASESEGTEGLDDLQGIPPIPEQLTAMPTFELHHVHEHHDDDERIRSGLQVADAMQRLATCAEVAVPSFSGACDAASRAFNALADLADVLKPLAEQLVSEELAESEQQ